MRRVVIDGAQGAGGDRPGTAGHEPCRPRSSGRPRPPAWFRALHDTSLVLTGICRPDGTFLDANRLAFEGCGFRPETEAGKPFWDTGWWARSAEVREQVRTWCREVAAGGPPVRAVTPYFLADGTQRLIDFTLHLVQDGDGESFLLPSGLDVTDVVAAERSATEAEALRALAAARAADLQALREVEARLSRALERSARVLDNVADGLYGLDPQGHVEFVNPAAERITGYAREDQLGHDQHRLIHHHRADGTPYPVEQCPVWRALRTGSPAHADEEVFWRPDGTPVPVELMAVPTRENGTVTGIVVSFRDLTDRLAAQRQAAELRRVSEAAAAQRALSDRLQEALLTPPPAPADLHVAVRYRPAAHEAHVGGDWYDAFVQPDGDTVLVIGDVVGHDSSAAAAMGQRRGALRALAYDDGRPLGEILRRVEHTAWGLRVATPATVLIARVECPDGAPAPHEHALRWSSAGHLPPLLLAPDGSATLLETRPDLMLGVLPDAPRHEHRAVLPEGTTLLLFTDGLVERRGSDLDAGLAALRAAVADLGCAPVEELCDTVLERLVPGAGEDDVALVAVRAR